MSANFQATAGELTLVSRILAQGDPAKTGKLAGDVAVRIFGGAKLQPTVLGEIWGIADEDNNGALTSKGIAVAVRLMGWAQKGDKVTPALLAKPGPLPTIDGVTDIGIQHTGMSVPRSPPPLAALPPLTPHDKAKFQNMFHKSGPTNGLLGADQARDIFVKSKLSNDKLGQIWTLADTHDRGSLDATDFTIAMYLIQGAMSGQITVLPQTLPQSLYQSASGLAGPTASVRSHATGNSGSYSPVGSTFSQNRIQPQYTGQMLQPNLTGGMAGRALPPHLPARPNISQVASSAFGTHAPPKWDITASEKTESDGFFDTLDTHRRGFIEGDVAVPFMLESKLPGEDLAQVWDLADLNNDGRLTKDGFAVAMYLIKKKLAGNPVPATLPTSLVPPSMRGTTTGTLQFTTQAPAPQDSLADLLWDDPPPAAAPPVTAQLTGHAMRSLYTSPALPQRSVSSPAPPPRPAAQDPFAQSPFGGSAAQDLLGDDEEATVSPPLHDQSVEIGNTQNQLSSTNRSLQTTKTDRETAEKTLANQASQLSSLQTQLASAKASYETETKLLSALRERLSTQTAEIQNTQVAIITAESDLSGVRVEKTEVEGALLRDKEEVRDLNRKMTEFSYQSDMLKAETEKLKKEAKQQRGLLAIARKQLSAKEAEKAKAQKEMEEAAAEVASLVKEKEEVESETARVEESISTLSSPAPSTFTASPTGISEHALSSDSLSFAASQALPITPDPSSPGGKSNNPFERLAMSSGRSTPTRSGSPFLPFAGTGAIMPSNGMAPAADPFGFDQVFAADAPAESATPMAIPLEISPVEGATSPTSPTQTEDFKTPPTTTSTLPDTVTPSRSNTLDAISSKFPAIDDATATSPKQVVFSGASAHTDMNAPLKELEVDESDSSDDEDEMPLAELAKSKSNGSVTSPPPDTSAAPDSSFDDIFGVGSTASAPVATVSSLAPAADALSSPFQTTSSPFVASDAFGAPTIASDEQPASPMAGVNAFDEAMGIIPPSGQAAPAPAFSFDSAFDDNFDFSPSTATPAFPPVPQANGTASPLATKNDGFDSLFTIPSTNGNGNGNYVAPPVEEHPVASTVSAPPPVAATSVPSFDAVFSSFDASLAPDLSSAPSKAPEPVAPTPFPATAASPKSINSVQTSSARPVSPTRERSPPPRVSSPTPRPRPSTSSSKEGDKLKEPTARHSKLSIRLPFGKKKKQQEAVPPPPSQFLTPPAEEPRTGSPAVEDDVEAVKQLTAMGFSRSQAVGALEKYGYDVPRALNSLLGQ